MGKNITPGGRPYKADAIAELLKKVANGGISADELVELLSDAPVDPPEPRRDTKLHKIGRVEVTYHVRRKVKFYEVLIDGKLVAQDRNLSWALHLARDFMPPKPEKKIKFTGELIAYRCWRLMGDILVPVSKNTDFDTWDGPVARSDVNPRDNSGSGLWAIKLNKPEAIQNLLRSYYPDVHGMVALSGTVVEHEIGYRAERATIRVLRVVPPVSDGLIKLLADRYQCQVFRVKRG